MSYAASRRVRRTGNAVLAPRLATTTFRHRNRHRPHLTWTQNSTINRIPGLHEPETWRTGKHRPVFRPGHRISPATETSDQISQHQFWPRTVVHAHVHRQNASRLDHSSVAALADRSSTGISLPPADTPATLRRESGRVRARHAHCGAPTPAPPSHLAADPPQEP